MAKRNHKSVRMNDDIRRLITARMLAENCTESEAIRSLLYDGAKATRPRPVLAQLGPPADLKKFFALLAQWQQDFQSIRARLAMADPDPKDTALCASVAKWRKLADELEPQARELSIMADAMAKALMGMDHSTCVNLAIAKRDVVQRIKDLKSLLVTNLPDAERVDSIKVLQLLETILNALEIFAL